MFDPIYASATEIAFAIREGEISAVEALEAHLSRIMRLNGPIHAVITLDEEGAMRRAQLADAALAKGEIRGPLHGVPITISDNFPTSGIRTTDGGNPKFADFVPSKDATVVARLKDAGAVIMGKTNDDHDSWGDAALFPPPGNPWDPTRILSGVGGPVAAVAAGFTSLDLGPDAGSVQAPAAFAGVFALRPTEHRIPLADVFFGHPVHVYRTITAIMPIARSLADLRLALEILSGPDGVDPDVTPVALGEYTTLKLRGLRIAWTPRIPGAIIDDEIVEGIESLVAELKAHGVFMEQTLPEIDFHEMVDVLVKVFRMPLSAMNEINEGTPGPSLANYLIARQRQDELRMIWDSFMDGWDAFLAPVAALVAPIRGQAKQVVNGVVLTSEQVAFSRVTGRVAVTSGLPTVVMPLGRNHEGLPFGVQVMGHRWHEMHLLAIAEQISAVAGGFVRPPGY